jgi:DNA-binding PadR family transcriptional regulator
VSLAHVLLGLLSEEARTGYELERAMGEELEPIWHAEFSQIYPALARLRRAGFVILRLLEPRRGPRRHLYRLTASGRRELRRWVAEASPPPRLRDQGLVRIAFLDALAPSERRHALAAQEEVVSREIRRLRSAAMPPGFRGKARRAALERVEAARRSIRQLLQEVEIPSGPATLSARKRR